MTTAHGSLTPAKIESTRSLIVVNALTIVAAIVFEWPLATLVFPYWIQSVVIGYYSRKRILNLDRFSTEGFTVNGQVPEENDATKRSTANFFALHYGFFHLGYLVFIAPSLAGLTWIDWSGIALASVSFAMAHRDSFNRNAAADRRGKPNIGKLMFLPYARIVPMHLTILAGGAVHAEGVMPLIAFGILKTGADVLMHVIEHRSLQKVPAVAA